MSWVLMNGCTEYDYVGSRLMLLFSFFRVYVYDTAACDEFYVPKLIYEVRAYEAI